MTARASRRGNWSVQELERLRQLLPRRGVETMAILLRRSADSVRRKAADLLRVTARRGAWSAGDDDLLRDAWGAVDTALLAIMLGRSSVEVRRRAGELRTRPRAGAWSSAELRRLKELYGTRSDRDLEVCLQRAGADIAAKAAAMCLAKDKRFAAGAAAAATPSSPPPAAARMPRWTAAEEQRLRDVYADRDNLAVARLLGRSVTSVANKANQLGLRKCPQLLASIGRANVALRYRSGDAADAAGT
jgi:hypothetical protein